MTEVIAVTEPIQLDLVTQQGKNRYCAHAYFAEDGKLRRINYFRNKKGLDLAVFVASDKIEALWNDYEKSFKPSHQDKKLSSENYRDWLEKFQCPLKGRGNLVYFLRSGLKARLTQSSEVVEINKVAYEDFEAGDTAIGKNE